MIRRRFPAATAAVRTAAIHRDPAATRAKAKAITAGVEVRQRHRVDAVRAAATRHG